MGSALADIFAFAAFTFPLPFPTRALFFFSAAGERALPILSAAAIPSFVVFG